MSININNILSFVDGMAQVFILIGAMLIAFDGLRFVRNLCFHWWKNRQVTFKPSLIKDWHMDYISLLYLIIGLIVHTLLADYAVDFDYFQVIISAAQGMVIALFGYTLFQLIKMVRHNHRTGNKLLLLNHENKMLLIDGVTWLMLCGVILLIFLRCQQ
ncbi:hypothetical protein [Moraxella cuniculi]|uniref:Uncharacterized protein n=1 Tax=Moraxella cuniculi TaxID=34061 RepID=A0A448GUL8_9GAMM|nr:hypothetical protein [Moraxella cuniculi]VEG12504.1 Uncharacterised protein [Moraxella cuniculi]